MENASARIGLVSSSRVPYFRSVMPVTNPSVHALSVSKAEAHPRFVMELSPELLEVLNRLANRSGESGDIVKVMQKAIALLDVAAQAADNNQKIGILDQDGKLVREIVGI